MIDFVYVTKENIKEHKQIGHKLLIIHIEY